MERVAFVTGASSGLGAEIAVRLAADGYAVALAARRAGRLDDVAARIHGAGGTASAHRCDVSDRTQVHAALEAAEAAHGPVDLLVANAGLSERTPAQALDALAVERMVRVNFMGAVYAAEAVLPGMLRRRSGHLVAVGSLAGYGGLPRTAAYSATKGALHNFFESLRIDVRGTGVDVTVITPGYVRTDMTAKNQHAMPFLMELEPAVDLMMRAVRRRRRLCAFPRPLSSLVWLAQLLPAAIYDRMGGRVRRG